MSRARIIVCSAGSTFSEWSAFLSDALVIRHPSHVHSAIRPVAQFHHLECRAPQTPAGWAELWKGVLELRNSKLGPVVA
jgi:gamma-glutamyl:cysteine ligase YbdK (ATP-grasp superfamily)